MQGNPPQSREPVFRDYTALSEYDREKLNTSKYFSSFGTDFGSNNDFHTMPEKAGGDVDTAPPRGESKTIPIMPIPSICGAKNGRNRKWKAAPKPAANDRPNSTARNQQHTQRQQQKVQDSPFLAT